MNILLYSEGLHFIKHSGVGRAILHQKKALDLNDISHTSKLSDLDACDVVHINTIGIQSYLLAKYAKYKRKKGCHSRAQHRGRFQEFFYSF